MCISRFRENPCPERRRGNPFAARKLDFYMAIHEQAIAHEAGHAVVALYLGLHLERIEVNNRRANCKVDLTSLKNKLDQCIFLSGGAAGELLCYGNYDQQGFGSDLSMISARGGSDVQGYIAEAHR